MVLQQAAEAGNPTAALELGATYDPTILQQRRVPKAQVDPTKASVLAIADMADAILYGCYDQQL